MDIRKDIRPWGDFVEFTHNEPSTVKILTVTPGQSLSLQKHNHRREFWKVLEGHPLIVHGDKTAVAKPGDQFMIPEQTAHRISAQADEVKILEISFGDFDENDIIRLEDNYGRV